jgi:CheY-like chemotaxis protein
VGRLVTGWLRHPFRIVSLLLRNIEASPEIAGIPVIGVTSFALSDDLSKALPAGCDGYVAKPFTPRQLLATPFRKPVRFWPRQMAENLDKNG